MKKTLILMAAASAFVLTGCTESDLSGDTSLAKESAPSAIQFSAKTRNAGATRATGGSKGDITTTVLKGANYGFGVMAYSTEATAWAGASNTYVPNFMYNQKVEYSTDHWTYTPVKFWPNEFYAGNVDDKQGKAGEDYNATGKETRGKVSFFAYAPFVDIQNYSAAPATDLGTTVTSAFKTYVGSENPTDGIVAISSNAYTKEPQVKYVLSTASLDQAVDLLWGVRAANTTYTLADGNSDNKTTEAYNTDLTKQAANETIDFLFKHALAKIGGHTYENPKHQTGLQVILDLDNGSTTAGVQPGTAITGGEKQANTLVTVESISIKDLKTYNSSSESDLIKSGWFNIATGVWSENTDKGATYSHEVTKSSTGDFVMNPNIAEPADASKLAYSAGWTNNSVAIPGVVTTTPTDVYTEDSKAPGLLLIPSPDYDQTLVVTVKYIVRTFDDHLATSANNDGATNGTWSKVEQTITNKVTIPKNSLKSNKFYKLLIHLGLTSVKFSATVADWEQSDDNDGLNTDDDNNKDIYLPSNTIASTVSVPAGGNLTVNTAAEAVTYTINLTGATNGNAYTATVSGDDSPSISPATGSFGTDPQEFTVTLPENTTASARDFVVKITDTVADVVTTVTITQAKQP